MATRMQPGDTNTTATAEMKEMNGISGDTSGPSDLSRRSSIAQDASPGHQASPLDQDNDTSTVITTGDATAPAAAAAAAAAAVAAAPEAQRSTMQTVLIMLSLASALFLAALDVTIVTVAVPTISEEFHSTVGYTWIGSAYLLANAASAPIYGKLSDIWGRKQVLLIAVAIFWVGSLIAALSVNMGMLIVARAIQGVGGGGINILVNVCISDLFSMRKRGMYFAMMGGVWAIAGGIGPVLGGVFTTEVTWRWCFYVNLPISGAGFVVLLFVLKLYNPRTSMREGLPAVDWLGALLIIGGTLMFLLGLTFGGVVHPWNSPIVICLIVFGLVAVFMFAIVEWKVAKFPIIPLRLFRSPAALACFGCSFFHGFVFISASYYLPLYFQAVLGATPLQSGTYILPYTIGLAIVSVASGIFIRKTGRYWGPLAAGMVLTTLGFGLFIDLDPYANWTKIILFQLVAGFGVGPNFQAPLIALQATIQQRDTASATATYAFTRQLATAISVVIGGVVFQNGMEKQYPRLLKDLGPEAAKALSGSEAAASIGSLSYLHGDDLTEARHAYYNALRMMYILYTAFAAMGIVVSVFVGEQKLSKQHTEAKTGLKAMQEEARKEEEAAARRTPADEEKAVKREA